MEKLNLDLALIEDHPLVAAIVCEVIRSLSPNLVYETFNTLEAFAAQPMDVKLVVADLGLPDAQGSQVLDRVKAIHPDCVILVYSALEEAELSIIRNSEHHLEVVSKKASPNELFEKLSEAMIQAGIIGTSESSVEKIRERNRFQSQIIAPGADKPLTNKQVAIMECCCRGLSSKETAAELDMSVETVRTHMSEIFYRLDVRNTAQAVAVYNNLKRLLQMKLGTNLSSAVHTGALQDQ